MSKFDEFCLDYPVFDLCIPDSRQLNLLTAWWSGSCGRVPGLSRKRSVEKLCLALSPGHSSHRPKPAFSGRSSKAEIRLFLGGPRIIEAAQRKADVRENVPVLNSGRSGLQCESGDADDTYSQADSQPKKRASQPNHPAKYSSTRSVVQVAIPVPKKSASSVHTGQAIVMAQASTGQSSASRMAIRCSAAACNPE